MFKFIHAADLHLDSPLRGLERYPGAPSEEIRGAARKALVNLVDLAIEERVDFVLLAGDLYDGDWKDYNTGLFLIHQISRLREAKIPVLMISGNHDAANKMTRSLSLPDNVTFFSEKKPETVTLEELGVAVHGQSYAKAVVLDDLSAAYPFALSSYFNIGLLHTCATGRDGHDNYAPCTIDGLRLHGYDYWALGHIHTREVLCEEPYIVFPGNIQGRHIREAGPKGCLLVTVGDNHKLDVEFRELDVMRWQLLDVNVSSADDSQEALELADAAFAELSGSAGGKTQLVRVHLTGTTACHRELLSRREHFVNEIRSQANTTGRGELWVEKVLLSTIEPQGAIPRDATPDGAIEELQALIQELHDSAILMSDLKFDLSDVMKKLPGDFKAKLNINDPQWMRSVLVEAESVVYRRLYGSEGST